MKILVTGGAGFIGQHLTRRLLADGHAVSVVDNLSTGKIEKVPSASRFYHLDIRDKKLATVLAAETPQVIFHLAAQTSVPLSIENPIQDADINIAGSLNLFRTCVENQVSKIIYSSTAAVYGIPESLPITEDHPVSPISGYGISKLTVEKYLQYYHFVHGIAYTVLRYANVYGEGQDNSGEGGVVAIFMQQALRRNRPKIFGDGDQTRDFIYIQDVVEANIRSLHQANQHILNISSGIGTSINRLRETIGEITGTDLIPDYRPPRSGDIRDSVLDNHRAAQLLGWVPAYNIKQGLSQYYHREKGGQGA